MLYVDDLVVLGPSAAAKAVIDDVRTRFSCTQAVDLLAATEKSPLLFLGHNMWVSEPGPAARCMCRSASTPNRCFSASK